MSYTIKVTRSGNSGKLTFNHGNVSVDTTCWWDPEVVIDPGTYTGYATRMANKNDGNDGGKREGIWFGKGVPINNGTGSADGIFIHKGKSASWSDGCIVCAESEVVKIWNQISPKEQANVTIEVSDATKDQPATSRIISGAWNLHPFPTCFPN